MQQDTPQHKAVLRQCNTARKVRARFGAGTRVRSTAGVEGTVHRHVPGSNAQGGTVVVDWDSGPLGPRRGRHSACALKVIA